MGTQDLSVHRNGVPFSPRLISSQQIVDGVENCLRHNPYLALKNIQCDFCEGVLTLRGCLPTYYLKQMAQAAVGRVAGIHRIVNEIEVISSVRH